MRNIFWLVIFFVGGYLNASGIQILQTHLEESGFTKLTPYLKMMDYLQRLDKTSSKVEIRIFGKSVEGRELPALYFSMDEKFGSHRDTKPLILIYCQQHGNEPSGKEAALIVARRLLNEESRLLKNLDLILIPQVNPDGSEMSERLNANRMDLNRNHVILSEPIQ